MKQPSATVEIISLVELEQEQRDHAVASVQAPAAVDIGPALSAARQFHPERGNGAQVGILHGFNSNGAPLVRLPDGDQLFKAISTVPLDHHSSGRSVVLLFECGDARRPIIVGLLPAVVEAHSRPQEPAEPAGYPASEEPLKPVKAKLDDHTVILTAEHEIQLRCGEASITLTRAGKVIIRGNYVLSRSRGANKIKGAYIDIN